LLCSGSSLGNGSLFGSAVGSQLVDQQSGQHYGADYYLLVEGADVHHLHAVGQHGQNVGTKDTADHGTFTALDVYAAQNTGRQNFKVHAAADGGVGRTQTAYHPYAREGGQNRAECKEDEAHLPNVDAGEEGSVGVAADGQCVLADQGLLFQEDEDQYYCKYNKEGQRNLFVKELELVHDGNRLYQLVADGDGLYDGKGSTAGNQLGGQSTHDGGDFQVFGKHGVDQCQYNAEYQADANCNPGVHACQTQLAVDDGAEGHAAAGGKVDAAGGNNKAEATGDQCLRNGLAHNTHDVKQGNKTFILGGEENHQYSQQNQQHDVVPGGTVDVQFLFHHHYPLS